MAHLPYQVTNKPPLVWTEKRMNILRSFPSKTEGVKFTRINAFMKTYGLTSCPVIYFLTEDLALLRKMVGEDMLQKIFLGGEWGVYIPELHLAFVRRDRFVERERGIAITESIAVHEKAHSAGATFPPICVFINEGSAYVARDGMALCQNGVFSNIPSWGWFFEEGFAATIESEYVGKYLDERPTKKLLKELGFPENFTLRSCVEMRFSSGINYPVSLKHVARCDENGSVFISPSAIASVGLELLCRKCPGLWNTLCLARDDFEYLKKVPKMVNAFCPGLYADLMRLKYTFDDFEKGTRLIIEKLFHGRVFLNNKYEVVV